MLPYRKYRGDYLSSFKKIRNEGDGAKLISANDNQNFTYRGRFITKEEAFAVGNETSQKLHNALKWIIRKQGRFFDTLAIVSWESNQLSMPKWNADTDTIASEYEREQEEDEWAEEGSEEETVSDTNAITAEKFYKALRGYGKKVDNTSLMFLLGFDAATPGRLAMIEEKTLDSARYLENIKKWHESCNWKKNTIFRNGWRVGCSGYSFWHRKQGKPYNCRCKWKEAICRSC